MGPGRVIPRGLAIAPVGERNDHFAFQVSRRVRGRRSQASVEDPYGRRANALRFSNYARRHGVLEDIDASLVRFTTLWRRNACTMPRVDLSAGPRLRAVDRKGRARQRGDAAGRRDGAKRDNPRTRSAVLVMVRRCRVEADEPAVVGFAWPRQDPKHNFSTARSRRSRQVRSRRTGQAAHQRVPEARTETPRRTAAAAPRRSIASLRSKEECGEHHARCV